MKKYIILLLFSLIALMGCDDKINLKPEDTISKENFFNTTGDFNQAITGLYSLLRPTDTDAINGAYFGNLYWEVCADVCMWKNSWTTPWFDISRGEMKAVTGGINVAYKSLYNTIFWANTIIQQMDEKAENFEPEFVAYVKGQAHFVRGICYLRLTSLWGNVPLIDKTYTPAEAKRPRASVTEIMENVIVPDLEIAADNLETTPYGSRTGLATKQSAIGMLVRAYLYVKDYENTIRSAQELMDLAKTVDNIKFLDDYKSIFSNDNEDNEEILFCLKYLAGGFEQGSTFNTTFGSKLPGLPSGSMNGTWETVSVLPEFIDSYPLIDGKTVAQGSTAIDPDPKKKWANRGPRFESTFYIGNYTVLDNGLLYDSTFVANISAKCKEDYPLSINKGYMNEDNKISYTNEDESDFIILRYTDVLMMYAEAKTMLNQIDDSVYEILDKVRDRAGIARVRRGQSQQEMMQTIMDERKWEFAFEGLRYFDIRRWGIAEQVINSITSDEKYDFGSHKVFIAPANYLWPIPQTAIDANPNLLPNNEGY
ncbi:RagB/SusD family nutrient uptake outer membrane protein [uncultured Bacteroides sp.]|uniref:RagB/SusD family nutrient uptake outer membrane protein n=1 Tax=uncultured Bacteroides sp. TaxID=162156 RepID=UPI0025D7CB65|nr:RagB/SusD family nutrient uptake outer membrane protein [uncultured Bacteroides sp.]